MSNWCYFFEKYKCSIRKASMPWDICFRETSLWIWSFDSYRIVKIIYFTLIEIIFNLHILRTCVFNLLKLFSCHKLLTNFYCESFNGCRILAIVKHMAISMNVKMLVSLPLFKYFEVGFLGYMYPMTTPNSQSAPL